MSSKHRLFSNKQKIDSDEEFEAELEDEDSKDVSPKKKKSKNSDTPKEFDLGNHRKVTVGEFAGKKWINIREYYVDKASGEEKPGKKGIALSVEQWANFMKQINEIDSTVKSSVVV